MNSIRKERERESTAANGRERARVTENGPEVEAIEGPKPRQHCESELVEPPRVSHRIFLR
jgi:hypothetical protein